MPRTASIWMALALLLLFVGGFALEMRASRLEQQDVQRELSAALKGVRAHLEALSKSIVGLLRDAHRKDATNPPALPFETTAAPQNDSTLEGISAEEDEAISQSADSADDGPALPAGVSAQSIVDTELPDLLKDQRFNPRQKRLTPIEATRASEEILQARAKKMLLSSEIRLAVVEGMELLRERGDFTVYEKGQRVEGIQGVLSAAEILQGGQSRLFYLFPDDFPELYEKRTERREVAKKAAKNVLAILAE